MNAKKSKQLRRLAKVEMSSDAGNQDRELVIAKRRGHDTVINNPSTTRAMYLALKSSYNRVSRG